MPHKLKGMAKENCSSRRRRHRLLIKLCRRC